MPQVLVTQAVERLLGLSPERADIGPRFVERLMERLEQQAPPFVHWLMAGIFHFAYAAGWGALYGAVQERRRLPPALAGPALGGAIYTIAFSRIGAATRTGSEPHPDRRRRRDVVLHWTPALTFGLCTAYGYEWLAARATTR